MRRSIKLFESHTDQNSSDDELELPDRVRAHIAECSRNDQNIEEYSRLWIDVSNLDSVELELTQSAKKINLRFPQNVDGCVDITSFRSGYETRKITDPNTQTSNHSDNAMLGTRRVCLNVQSKHYNSDVSNMFQIFVSQLPHLQAAQNCTMYGLQAWDRDIRSDTRSRICKRGDLRWRLYFIGSMLNKCKVAMRLIHESIVSVPHIERRVSNVICPDLFEVAARVFPTVNASDLKTLIQQLTQHIYTGLRVVSVMWLEIYTTQHFDLLVRREPREQCSPITTLENDTLTTILCITAKRCIRNQTPSNVQLITNVYWVKMINEVTTMRQVCKTWNSLNMWSYRIALMQSTPEPRYARNNNNNDSTQYNLAKRSTHPTQLQCQIERQYKLEQHLKTLKRKIDVVQSGGGLALNSIHSVFEQQEAIANQTILSKYKTEYSEATNECKRIRTNHTGGYSLYEFVSQHNATAAKTVNREPTLCVSANLVYAVSAMNHCRNPFQRSTTLKKSASEAHFVNPTTNQKSFTTKLIMCLRLQMVHAFFGVVFAHPQHQKQHKLRCEVTCINTQQEPIDITQWLIDNNKLFGSHGTDVNNIELRDGGAEVYFKMTACNRELAGAIGVDTTTKLLVRFVIATTSTLPSINENKCVNVNNYDNEVTRKPRHIVGEWMTVRTETTGKFMETMERKT